MIAGRMLYARALFSDTAKDLFAAMEVGKHRLQSSACRGTSISIFSQHRLQSIVGTAARLQQGHIMAPQRQSGP